MDHFEHRNGRLMAEDVDVAALAEAVGTPFYCYSSGTIERHFTVFRDAVAGAGNAPPLVAYAVKANSNQAVIATLARIGAGADVVSLGEMKRALAAGVPAERIVFSGVGKTAEEMEAAVQAGVYQINLESLPEAEMLSEVATRIGRTVPVVFRVNPDVDAGTHAKISTGKAENKFGIPIDTAQEAFALAAALPGIEPVGVALHIGSQLTDLAPLEKAFTRLGTLIADLRAAGFTVSRADLGGGLGVPYSAHTPRPPLPPHLRAGARDCRQRRRARLARHPREDGRDDQLRHHRRGDERSAAPQPLRRMARHRFGDADGSADDGNRRWPSVRNRRHVCGRA